MNNLITLEYGDGGKHTEYLLKELFLKYFDHPFLLQGLDAAVFEVDRGVKLAYTTDSFVVKPLFFRGGDIGKLSICGTVNDLAALGASPSYISAAFVIEEGFQWDTLEKIVGSMKEVCTKIGASIVTGDTKVVEKGNLDGIFINTSGIGVVQGGYFPKALEPGDAILVTGPIGEHGTTIAVERYNLQVDGNIRSDCAPLYHIPLALKENLQHIKLMRDPTRGGIATILNEIAARESVGIELQEIDIPIIHEVEVINRLLGMDPLYMASEGRMVMMVEKGYEQRILSLVRTLPGFNNASIIGKVVKDPEHLVYMKTVIGGRRVIDPLEGKMLPRIC